MQMHQMSQVQITEHLLTTTRVVIIICMHGCTGPRQPHQPRFKRMDQVHTLRVHYGIRASTANLNSGYSSSSRILFSWSYNCTPSTWHASERSVWYIHARVELIHLLFMQFYVVGNIKTILANFLIYHII